MGSTSDGGFGGISVEGPADIALSFDGVWLEEMAEGPADGSSGFRGLLRVLLEDGRAATLERFRLFGICVTAIEQVERGVLERVPRKEGACFTVTL